MANEKITKNKRRLINKFMEASPPYVRTGLRASEQRKLDKQNRKNTLRKIREASNESGQANVAQSGEVAQKTCKICDCRENVCSCGGWKNKLQE